MAATCRRCTYCYLMDQRDGGGRVHRLESVSASAERGAAEQPSRGRMRLVVIEAGAGDLESHVPPDGSDHTVVVVQSAKDRPGEAVRRSIRRIQSLERDGHALECTILALAPRFDREATAARLALARALATHAATTGSRSSELVLSSPVSMRDQPCAGLLSLVDHLTGDPGNWSLSVRIEFGEREAGVRSGISAAWAPRGRRPSEPARWRSQGGGP